MNADRAAGAGEAGAIERAAAEWALRAQGGLRGGERRELEAWLRADARHAAAFAEMRETSRLLDQLRDPARAAEPAPARRRWLLPAGFAAAAAVVVLLGIAGAGFPAAREVSSQSFATEIGASRTVDLPDGSRLRLNTDSAVETIYTAAERRVRLTRGEAFFTVARNPQRPFWVEAGGVSVRAVGTAFNVRFRSQAVEVLVKEGKVSVDRPAPPVAAPAAGAATAVAPPPPARLVVAGERATVSLSRGGSREPPAMVVAAVAAPRLENALAWQEGRLEFTDTPLADVVAEFNRYNRHQLTIADASLGAEPFGGAFAARGYEAFIEVLEQSFGVVAERRGHATSLRRNPAAVRPR